MEELKKASRNVTENRNAVPTSEAHKRMMKWLRERGLRVTVRNNSNENGNPSGGKSNFGGGKFGQAVTNYTRDAVGYDHEAAHALLSNPGQTLKERQRELGNIGTDFSKHPDVKMRLDERATQALQTMIRRRLGLDPVAPVTPKEKMAFLEQQDPSFYNRYAPLKVVDGMRVDQTMGGEGYRAEQKYLSSKPRLADKRAQALEIARARINALQEGRLKLDGLGRMVPGTSIHAKINARAMKLPFEEDFAKSEGGGSMWQNNPDWPIFSKEDENDLYNRSVVKEFHEKKSRHQADAEAYYDWRREQHAKAAAHHLRGMKAAQGSGDMEQGKKHGLLYNHHMNMLGHDPYLSPPEEVSRHIGAEPTESMYKFKPHPTDSMTYHSDTLNKSEYTEMEAIEAIADLIEKLIEVG